MRHYAGMGVAVKNRIEKRGLFAVDDRPSREQRRKSLVDELASLCAQAYGILLSSAMSPMSNEESADYRRCRKRIGQICEILETVESGRFPESSSA
jgi:hypothetical protein